MGGSRLALPARQAAADYVRHLSKQADAACLRLSDATDAEALHDFRVAIRRARSWLGAYRLYLPLDKPLRRRLRALARRTNAARDAEVSMAALQAMAGRLSPAQRPGLRWLQGRLEQERQQAYADILDHIPATWPKLGRDLRRHLRRQAKASSPSPSLAQAAFELAAAAEAELAQRLTAIGGEGDVEAMHQARIAAKRLRYLLEPFREVPGLRETVQHLTALQDGLGELHDGQVLLDRLANALEDGACSRARQLLALTLANPEQAGRPARRGRSEQPGLLALAGLTVQQQHQRYAALRSRYLGGRLRPFLDDMDLPISRLADASP